MNMKGVLDMLNTLFQMSISHCSPEEACYYAAPALKQASGKKCLPPHQKSQLTKLSSPAMHFKIHSGFP